MPKILEAEFNTTTEEQLQKLEEERLYEESRQTFEALNKDDLSSIEDTYALTNIQKLLRYTLITDLSDELLKVELVIEPLKTIKGLIRLNSISRVFSRGMIFTLVKNPKIFFQVINQIIKDNLRRYIND